MARHGIDPREYQQKRYEISKDLLTSYYTSISIERLIDDKQRDSVIFNCIQLADMLMNDLGYVAQASASASSSTKTNSVPNPKTNTSAKGDEKSIHNLTELLKKNEDDDE